MEKAGPEQSAPGREPWQSGLGRVDGIDLHAQHLFEPTGGDLFDTVRIGSRIAFLLSDIAGRRPELNPISAEMRKAFRAISAELFRAVDTNLMEAAEMLVHGINQAAVEAAQGVRFAPTMAGCYDAQLGVLAYINAGGQTALFHDSEGTRALPNASVPLGMFTHLPYKASIQAFEPGAVLLVVTKGVTESMRGKSPSGLDELVQAVQSSQYESASGICQTVLDAALRLEKHRREWLPFRAGPVREDMTALALVRTV